MFEIYLSKIKCIDKQSFANDSDEPYVLVFTVNLALSPVPGANTTIYGPYSGMDDGEEVNTREFAWPVAHLGLSPKLCWGPSGNAEDITNPEDVLILVCLMESDTNAERANTIRSTAHSQTVADLIVALPNYRDGTMSRHELVNRLRTQFADGINTLTSNLPFDTDDRLGNIQELVITSEEIESVRNGIVVEKSFVFKNRNNDYKYELVFMFTENVGISTSPIQQGNRNKLYAGVWRSGTDAYYLWESNWDGFIAKWNVLNKKNLRLVDIKVFPGEETTFTGVWREGSDSHYLWVGVDWESFNSKWEELSAQNLRLVDLEIYNEGGVTKFAGVWREGSDSHYLWVGVDWESFNSKWDELAENGLRLQCIEIYKP